MVARGAELCPGKATPPQAGEAELTWVAGWPTSLTGPGLWRLPSLGLPQVSTALSACTGAPEGCVWQCAPLSPRMQPPGR